MANITEILSSYGSAARANYPHGDDVEDAMDYIVNFINQHGYKFEDELLDELRRGLNLCPIHDVFKGFYRCKECKFAVEKGNRYIWYDCEFRN